MSAARRAGVLAMLLTLGCWAEPPPPAHPGDLGPCHEGSYGALGPDRCERDADCAVCLDGSRCGRPVSRATLAAEGEACTRDPRAEDCEEPYVACCRHRCVLVLEPPAL